MLTRHPIAYHVINTPPEPLLDINEINHFQNIENTSAPKCFKRDGVFVVKRQGLAKIIVPKALRVKLMETSHKKFGHPDNEVYPPLEEARKLAKERTEQYYKINKIRYDKKFQEADFKVGDFVMYEEFQYLNTRKLSPPYSCPYTVLRKCSDVFFEIDRSNALNKTDTELVHSARLRHFHPSENFQLNYIQQNTHNNEKIMNKRNLLRNTEVTEFCLTRLLGEKE
ncbi:retrotransposable element Tf2 protein type 1 [Trichonephila clavipes]|nr:retrotransposable element Tf2 protein type 1 [Trichonephila clavipes]